jgi:hypothetical protein
MENPQALWHWVAQHWSNRPYPLIDVSDSHYGEAAQPESWRNPDLVLRLMDRVLTEDHYQAMAGEFNYQTMARDSNGGSHDSIHVCLIIEDLHQLVPASGPWPEEQVTQNVGRLRAWAANRNMVPPGEKKGNIVLLLTPEPGALHPDVLGLGSQIVPIFVRRPDAEQRRAFLTWIGQFDDWPNSTQSASQGQRSSRPLDNREVISRLVANTGGFNYAELRELARTIQTGANAWDSELASQHPVVVNRASRGLISIIKSDHGTYGVAGYKYAGEVDGHVKRLKTNEAQDTRGVLFIGPSGTGKTYYVKALAKDCGVPVVQFNPALLWRPERGPQFERDMALIWATLTDIAPAVIFVDELDRVLPDRYFMGHLLQMIDWSRDSHRLLWVAATNRPDLMDPVILSRFPLVVPFLLPDLDTATDLLRRVYPDKLGFKWDTAEWARINMDKVISDPDKGAAHGRLSGRDLEMVVREAIATARKANVSINQPVSPTYLAQALSSVGGGREKEYLHCSLFALLLATVERVRLCQAATTALPSSVVSNVLSGFTGGSTTPAAPGSYRLNKAGIAKQLGI